MQENDEHAVDQDAQEREGKGDSEPSFPWGAWIAFMVAWQVLDQVFESLMVVYASSGASLLLMGMIAYSLLPIGIKKAFTFTEWMARLVIWAGALTAVHFLLLRIWEAVS